MASYVTGQDKPLKIYDLAMLSEQRSFVLTEWTTYFIHH